MLSHQPQRQPSLGGWQNLADSVVGALQKQLRVPCPALSQVAIISSHITLLQFARGCPRRGGGATHHSILSYQERMASHLDALARAPRSAAQEVVPVHPSLKAALLTPTPPSCPAGPHVCTSLPGLVAQCSLTIGLGWCNACLMLKADQSRPPLCARQCTLAVPLCGPFCSTCSIIHKVSGIHIFVRD